MTRFGNKQFIAKTIQKLGQDEINDREIDGMIALSVFSRPASSASYEFCYGDSQFPFAIVMKYRRSLALHNDVIEFPNPAGPGYILMNEAKVPHFTTKIDDGLLLLDDADWIVSRSGLVKCEKPIKLRAKLATPALSLCAIGLQLHLARHTIVTQADHSSDLIPDILTSKCPEG